MCVYVRLRICRDQNIIDWVQIIYFRFALGWTHRKKSHMDRSGEGGGLTRPPNHDIICSNCSHRSLSHMSIALTIHDSFWILVLLILGKKSVIIITIVPSVYGCCLSVVPWVDDITVWWSCVASPLIRPVVVWFFCRGHPNANYQVV